MRRLEFAPAIGDPARMEQQPSPERHAGGPVTPEGKAAVRHNSVRYGLRTVAIVVDAFESQADWDQFRSEGIAALDPDNPVEYAIAERIVEHLWRLRRGGRAEAQMISIDDFTNDKLARDLEGTSHAFTPLHRLLPEPRHMEQIIRYEAHHGRRLSQALRDLEALQERRKGNPTPLARLDITGLPEP
jgi:hypothetical protein